MAEISATSVNGLSWTQSVARVIPVSSRVGSPEYYIDSTTGNISLTSQNGYTKVNAVPAGYSYADYILGNEDNRLAEAKYGTVFA